MLKILSENPYLFAAVGFFCAVMIIDRLFLIQKKKTSLKQTDIYRAMRKLQGRS
jgi:hypothetical protein